MRSGNRTTQVTLRVTCALALGLALFLSGCSDPAEPGAESLETLDLTVPGTIVAGESFTMTIKAVGSRGTIPLTSVEGEVALSVSAGTITPAKAVMVDGVAAVEVVLSGVDGMVQVSARLAQAVGARDLSVISLRALPGDPSDKASASIPDLDYFAHEEDFRDDHPDLPDLSVSINTLLLNFTQQATVGQANEFIARIGGAIVGGIPGTGSGAGGLLMLRVPATSHAEMDALVASLANESVILFAERDVALVEDFVPDSGSEPADWTWERGAEGGNWGMEICRMPQMWNLKEVVGKRGDPTILTGVVDAGIGEHDDLVFQRVRGAGTHYHGTFVCGILAGQFNNKKGIDGVSPYAGLLIAGPLGKSTSGDISKGIQAVTGAGARVVNISMGWDWRKVHPDDAPVKRTMLAIHARLTLHMLDGLKESGAMPLIIVSSGNDSESNSSPVEARWNSPLSHAALELGATDIIVVEAIEVEDGGRRLPMSNPGGHISAPGGQVLSTTLGGGFFTASGTSAAAPHVAGLASYLLSIDPSLTNSEVTALLMDNRQPTFPNRGVAASPRIDAFASALAIDGLRGDAAVVRMLLDIDDGTLDGNQRVQTDDPTTDFVDADADGDGGIGDGVIDMSDFRRWRDWYHQTAETPGALFDGSANHIKFDVNGSGGVETPARENIYPRADFNGDGTLDIAATAVVPGDFSGPQSDFEVLARYFDDPAFPEETLDRLVFSGDIHVDLKQLVDSGRFTEVKSEIATVDGDLIEIHEHTAAEPACVFTVENDVAYEVTAWGISNGDTLCTSTESFEPGLCEDLYWAPVCAGVTVEITLAEFIAPGSASPLDVRAGLVDAQGDIVFQDGLQLDILATGGTLADAFGFTDTDGFFNTEVTMGPGSQQLNVFVTATDPITGESAVATATALPLLANSGVRPVCESIGLHVAAVALVGGGMCEQRQNFNDDEGCNFTPFMESFSAGCSISDPDCGGSVSTTAAGGIQFQPEFHPVTGDLIAITVSGSVSASLNIESGQSCGQIGNEASSVASFNAEFEVVGESVPVRLTGSVDLASSGNTRPRFGLTTDGPFELLFPETGLAFDETWDYGTGKHRLEIQMRAFPENAAGVSEGGFTVELRFGP